MSDLAELVVLLDHALEATELDLEAVNGEGEGGDLWPGEIVAAMEELLALRAAMKRAVELSPGHREELKRIFRQERAQAIWNPPPFPDFELLPETTTQITQAREQLRRTRLFDDALDRECKGVLLPDHVRSIGRRRVRK